MPNIIDGGQFQKLAKLLEKFYQTHRIYNAIWNERAEIYSYIIVRLKKGKGFFRKKPADITKDFASELSRLYTLNRREQKVITAILNGKEETLRIAIGIAQASREVKKSYKQFQDLERLSKVVDNYLNSFCGQQLRFLEVEKKLIQNPTIENLRVSYCSIKNLKNEILGLQELYDKRSKPFNDIINVQKAINDLVESVDKKILKIKEVSSKDKAKDKLIEILQTIKGKFGPYFDKSNRQLYGNFSQRVALNTTDFTKIIISIGIRMAFIAPFLNEELKRFLGYAPRWTIPLIGNYYLDIYLFILSYIAYVTDVIPGLAKYSIEGPQKLLAIVKADTGYDDPLGFKC